MVVTEPQMTVLRKKILVKRKYIKKLVGVATEICMCNVYVAVN